MGQLVQNQQSIPVFHITTLQHEFHLGATHRICANAISTIAIATGCSQGCRGSGEETNGKKLDGTGSDLHDLLCFWSYVMNVC